MPRNYKCKKCGIEHSPPTGKHCQQHADSIGAATDLQPQANSQQNADQLLALMLDMKTKMEGMEQNMSTKLNGMDDRIVRMEERGDHGQPEPSTSRQQPQNIEQNDGASPVSLRANLELMAQAAGRIAQLGTDDDDMDNTSLFRQKTQGKKSGSKLMPSDTVEKQIDWPHMHVKRLVAGRRKDVAFADLRTDEFAFGYMQMLLSPRSQMDRETMLRIFTMVMQDSMDYSWSNARAFYEMVGIAVEKKELQWGDSDAIREMRMTYSRAVFPDKQDNKDSKEGPKQLRQAPPAMKCCVAFQRKTCEQNKDHTPFTHACSYCHRVCGALCRHAEDDCMRKMTDESKNGKKRES